MLTVLGLAFLITLIAGGQAALAQGEIGDYCVGAYYPGAVCTASDTPDTNYVVHRYINNDVCTMQPDDSAQIEVMVEIIPRSSQRSDFGIFMALDGGLANRNAGLTPEAVCYHDYLAPPVIGSDPPPPNGNCPCPNGASSCTVEDYPFTCSYNPGTAATGGGPVWYEADLKKAQYAGDACGDVESNVTTYFKTAEITLDCNDDNPADGLLDAVGVCVSWDNQNQYNCTDVKQAFPNTKAKCDCDPAVDLGVIIYEGIDYGDLPDTYSTTLASGGASHAIHQDTGSDGLPDADGFGSEAVWLGPAVETETDAKEPLDSTGDDTVTGAEEDGIAVSGKWNDGTAELNVTVSTSGGSGDACLNAWLDFTGDGGLPQGWGDGDFYDLDYDPGTVYDSENGDGTGIDEWVIENQAVSADTVALSFPLPLGIAESSSYYMRFRLTPRDAGGTCTGADTYQGGAAAPQGLAHNGEVEDYRFSFGPTAVTLSSFGARPSAGGRVAIALAALALLVAALLAGFALVRRRGWIGG